MSHIEEQEASLTQSIPSLKRMHTNDGNKVPASVDLNRTASEEKTTVADAVILSAESSDSSGLSERTRREKVASVVQFTALCWSMAVVGWNDASTGPLLPRLREVYGVSYLCLLTPIQRLMLSDRSVSWSFLLCS